MRSTPHKLRFMGMQPRVKSLWKYNPVKDDRSDFTQSFQLDVESKAMHAPSRDSEEGWYSRLIDGCIT